MDGRAGKHGEHEPRFFGGNRIYLTWNELGEDLHDVKDKAAIRKRLWSSAVPTTSSRRSSSFRAVRIRNHKNRFGTTTMTPQKLAK
jgi:hypothetical protein